MEDVCRVLNLKHGFVHNLRSLNVFLAQDPLPQILLNVNARSQDLERLPKYRGFHVIRDPRDIVVSGYFSHLYSHREGGWLEEHRAALEKASIEQGLFLEMDFEKHNFEALFNWDYSRENVLELRMEDLIKNPNVTMTAALDFVGLIGDEGNDSENFGTLPRSEILQILHEHRYVAKANGREEGEEDIRHHYRKGIAGDWKNYFSEDHKEYFKEKYGNGLISLGYEQDTDW